MITATPEMQILANFNHPNIARLFDGGETANNIPYLVMEGALENQQEALRIREMLVAADPNKARAQRALTISYEFLGFWNEFR